VTGNEATTANVNAITIVAAKSMPIFLMPSDILPRGYKYRHY
jgi:hypothetical protein